MSPPLRQACEFNMPKDVFVPDVADWCQKRGFTALIFDTFGIGASEGEPRHNSDIMRRIDDFTDSVTWLFQNPLVDPERIAVWGLCWDDNIILATAAYDRRIAAVVTIAPLIDVTGDPDRGEAIFELGLTHRAACIAGEESTYLPLIHEAGFTPLGQFLRNFFATIDSMKMPIENSVTAHTHRRCLNWNILHLLPKISSAPVKMVTPENDQMFPSSMQKEVFDLLNEPKQHCVIYKKHHFDWMFGNIDEVFDK